MTQDSKVNKHERYFYDERRPDEQISESQLKQEYAQLILSGSIDPIELSFIQHLGNCLSIKGGTLTEVLPEREKLATFKFLVREISSDTVEVDAVSLDEAKEIIRKQYDNGDIDLDYCRLDKVEFRPRCSKCNTDFDEDDLELYEVNAGTPLVMMLCNRCFKEMGMRGQLLRCECCDEVFSASRLKNNPSNDEKEICPECGKVWF